MQKTPSLEDFIKTYVQNKEIENKKESYAEWVAKNGVGKTSYSQSALGLNTSLARSRAGYGSEGESVANSGLISSGYANYLASQSKRENASLMADASYIASLGRESEEKRYTEYVDSYNRDVEKKSKDVSLMLSRAPTTDYEKAYKYAIDAGLPRENAESVAKEATQKEIKRLKEIVLESIGKDKLTSEEAYDYAIAIGLSAPDAKELSSIANKRNELVDRLEEDLLIRKLSAKERIETKRNKKG